MLDSNFISNTIEQGEIKAKRMGFESLDAAIKWLTETKKETEESNSSVSERKNTFKVNVDTSSSAIK